LATTVELPYLFGVLRQPGVPLLLEILGLLQSRPGLTTGAVLEHFAGREEEASLQKLAMSDVLAEPDRWESELWGALKRLDLDTLRQRESDLKQKLIEGGSSALTPEEKDEMRGIQPQIRRMEDAIKVASNISEH